MSSATNVYFRFVYFIDVNVISNGKKKCKQILYSNDMHVEAFKWKCTDDCKLFYNKSKTKQDGLMDGYRHS